ncbi:hypothetical protein, partial [Nocardiopsis alba]|uniref:hypothetical protein n=1 Tax=Nocardiopsis alba TaxID=53437 RepID=UPI0033DB91C5
MGRSSSALLWAEALRPGNVLPCDGPEGRPVRDGVRAILHPDPLASDQAQRSARRGREGALDVGVVD